MVSARCREGNNPEVVLVMEYAEIKCFFITPIGEEGSEVRYHADDMLTLLESAMSKLEKYKVSVIRSDLKVDVRDDNIDNEMIRDICDSKLCVADVSGANPNVMYELGYRRGIKKNVIVICQKKNGKDERQPFDIEHQPIIFYDMRDVEWKNRLKCDLIRRAEGDLKNYNADAELDEVTDKIKKEIGDLMVKWKNTIVNSYRASRGVSARGTSLGGNADVQNNVLMMNMREATELMARSMPRFYSGRLINNAGK